MDALRESFVWLTEASILLIDFAALLVVMFATLEAAAGAARAAFRPGKSSFHVVWLRYGRWLVAALTFQLAADIVESALAPDWEDIGRLAAIALIRTFLNYFLERDLSEIEARGVEDIGDPAAQRSKEG